MDTIKRRLLLETRQSESLLLLINRLDDDESGYSPDLDLFLDKYTDYCRDHGKNSRFIKSAIKLILLKQKKIEEVM